MLFLNSPNIFNSAWHVFAAAFIFFLGAWIALIQYRLFKVPQRLALGFYFWHSIFCLFYLVYSQSNTADSVAYFNNSWDFDGLPTPGTTAIIFLTALFTQGLNLSYGGVFLVFNIVGFIGMLALASCVLELTRDSSRNVRLMALIILLLPGLSFWSSAIGKDALSFFAACLACWGAMDPIRRFPGMILAVLVLLLVRPHMAASMLLAFGVSMIISGRGSVMTRVFLIALTITAASYTVSFVLVYIGIGSEARTSAMIDFIAQRQSANTEGGLGLDIISMPVPVRMLTYLYRPFFVDGGGLLGLIVSIENAVLLMLSVAAAYLWFKRRKSALLGFNWWFLAIFTLTSWLILSNTTANLGIAMRQKWMFMPMILILCFSYIGRPLANNQRTRN